MANPARESLSHYFPAKVMIYANGVLVNPSVGVILPDGVRTAELHVVVINRGAVNSTGGKPTPLKHRWSVTNVYGGVYAAVLSPTSPSTRLEILNPLDILSITLEVETQFETVTQTFTVTVPAASVIPDPVPDERVWYFPATPTPFFAMSPQGFSSVAVSDDGVVGVLDNSGNIWLTSNGDDWTNAHTVTLEAPVPDIMLGTITYGGGQWVAILYHDVSPAIGPSTIMRSSNGVDWTEDAFPAATWLDIEYRNGKFIATGYHSTDGYSTSYGVIATSTDGSMWSHQDVATVAACFGVEFFNGTYVIASSSPDASTNTTLISTDAAVWTAGASSTVLGSSPTISADDEGFLLRVYGELGRSTDGVDWTIASVFNMIPWPGGGEENPETNEWAFTDIAFDGSAYAAGGSYNGVNGYVFNSYDLVTWTKADGSPDGYRSWSRTAFGGGVIATASDSGHFAISLPPVPTP